MSVALAEAQEESPLTGDQLLARAVARRTGHVDLAA
jgi:hypothetical protein